MDVVRRNIEKSAAVLISRVKREKAHQSHCPPAYTCNYRWNGRSSWQREIYHPYPSIEESFRPKKEEIITIQKKG